MNNADIFDFHLLNDWQRGFPLVERPFAEIARKLNTGEEAVLLRLRELTALGRISRVGAVFRPHVLGWSTLAAVSCPAHRIAEVAARIDAHPEVNHNYEREHAFNLWFVVAAQSRERVADVLDAVRDESGLDVLDLPMEQDYHIDLGFDLTHGEGRAAGPVLGFAEGGERPHLDAAACGDQPDLLRAQLSDVDVALAHALEGGLPLSSRPFAAVAERAGMSEPKVRERLARMLELSVIRRLGVVVRHREMGWRANAMVVWDVPDAEADALGARLGAQRAVTLCYRRPRRAPDWPYNLFTMIHGRDRAAVLAELTRLRARLGIGHLPHEALFSTRRFKQCGARYAAPVELARAA
jgi:DNA-binding Lrp family transcriptional regulator